MRREQIGIIVFAGWLLLISIFMLVASMVNFEIFFVLSLIVLVIIVELIAPKYIQPRYMRYNRYIIAVGIVIFAVIVAEKVLGILGFEIVFQ